ncbi:hypothetical protein ATN79_44850 [Paraburkholderia caribensis]|nr:hypothetical protein ATN79_44850 [Paraburkholderia caribensis]
MQQTPTLRQSGGKGFVLKPTQFTTYAPLALGSVSAAFVYLQTMSGVLSCMPAKTVSKNAIPLPAYTPLVGLIAILGYMAIAAGIHG